jgi:hypothetical protein
MIPSEANSPPVDPIILTIGGMILSEANSPPADPVTLTIGEMIPSEANSPPADPVIIITTFIYNIVCTTGFCNKLFQISS